MIKHVVMFKFKDEAKGRTKEENVQIAKNMILNLKQSIDVLRFMEVGINSKEADNNNYDLVLNSEFDTIQHLKEYAVHQEHIKVVNFIKEVVETRSCVDYKM